MQVYKGLDIGSSKPGKEEREKYKHYLIDIREPFESFNAFDFCRETEKAIEDSREKGLRPVVSGGCGFYLRELIFGQSGAPSSDKKTREKVEERVLEKGLESLYEYLKEIDPISYKRLNKNDQVRIKRAVEVYLSTGFPLSSFKRAEKPREDYIWEVFFLRRDRAKLRERIYKRIELMLKEGLVEEVEGLKKRGLSLKNQCMNSIGYREFFLFDVKTELEKIKEQIFLDTCHYAKRQETFFRGLARQGLKIKEIELS